MEAALLLAPLVAALALLYGWFCVRLSGVYLTMLTLAFAQISWAIVFQWDDFTGGSNGLTGVAAGMGIAGRAFYWLALALVALGICCCAACCFRRWAMRCAPRAIAAARRCHRHRRAPRAVDGFRDRRAVGRLAGALFAFSKGGVAPDAMSVTKSVDGLVMVLLGGVQTLAGPWWARRALPGCTTPWRATPNTGARCWAPPC
jgi:branched-chain amino acid transport system permease protein